MVNKAAPEATRVFRKERRGKFELIVKIPERG
jgi:hypothetical protein